MTLEEQLFKEWWRLHASHRGYHTYGSVTIMPSNRAVILSHRGVVILSISRISSGYQLQSLGGDSAMDERIINWVLEEDQVMHHGIIVGSVNLLPVEKGLVRYRGYYLKLNRLPNSFSGGGP